MILLPYIVALHTSIAMMELFGWFAAISGLTFALVKKRRALRQFVFKYKTPLAALLGLWLWVAISLVSSPLEKPFMYQFGFMRWVLLLIGLSQAMVYFGEAKSERKWVWVWSACLLITGLYAGLQFFTGIDLIRPGRGLVNPQGGGIFKAVGFFSMSLTFAYVFGLSLFAVSRRVYREWGYRGLAVFVAVGALGITASMSRGAWISAAVCSGLFLALYKKKWFLPFAGLLVAAVISASLLDDGIGIKLRQMLTLQMDNSSNVRVDLWRGYFEMFKDHPLMGVGLLEGDILLPEYYSRLGINQSFTSHAHNNFMQWLAGAGLPGLLLYCYLSFFFLRGAWQLRKRDAWGWGLFLAQIYFHLGGLTECNFFDGEVNHFVIFVWALTWARLENFTVLSPASKR